MSTEICRLGEGHSLCPRQCRLSVRKLLLRRPRKCCQLETRASLYDFIKSMQCHSVAENAERITESLKDMVFIDISAFPVRFACRNCIHSTSTYVNILFLSSNLNFGSKSLTCNLTLLKCLSALEVERFLCCFTFIYLTIF